MASVKIKLKVPATQHHRRKRPAPAHWRAISNVQYLFGLVLCIYIYLFICLFTTIGLSPCGSGYFTCKQNMKSVTSRFKSGGLHEKHVVATWNLGNYLSICL